MVSAGFKPETVSIESCILNDTATKAYMSNRGEFCLYEVPLAGVEVTSPLGVQFSQSQRRVVTAISCASPSRRRKLFSDISASISGPPSVAGSHSGFEKAATTNRKPLLYGTLRRVLVNCAVQLRGRGSEL